MRNNIKIEHLFQEVKRKWVVILIVGIIGCVLGVAKTVAGIRSTQNSVKYASTCILRIEEIEDATVFDQYGKAIAQKDMEDVYKAVLCSDFVLSQISKSINGKLSQQQIKDAVYTQGKSSGEIINVIVLTENQELSNIICSNIETLGSAYLKQSCGLVSVQQATTDLGCATVTVKKATTSQEKDVIELTCFAYPTVSISSLAKKGIIGFGVAACIMIILIIMSFLLNKTLIYENDLSIKNILSWSICLSSQAVTKSSFSLLSQGNAEIQCIQLCCDDTYEEFKKFCSNNGIKNANKKDATVTIIVAEKRKTPITEVEKTINLLEQLEQKIFGVVIVEK